MHKIKEWTIKNVSGWRGVRGHCTIGDIIELDSKHKRLEIKRRGTTVLHVETDEAGNFSRGSGRGGQRGQWDRYRGQMHRDHNQEDEIFVGVLGFRNAPGDTDDDDDDTEVFIATKTSGT
ncbi:MAG: hypothetical protein AAF657_28760 [Acidobacteriota bacterium]